MGFWLAFFKKQQKIKQQKNQPLKLWYFKIPFSWKVLLFEKLNLAGLWYQFGAIRRLKAYCFLFTRRCWGLLLLQIFRDCCMLLWVVVDRWFFLFFFIFVDYCWTFWVLVGPCRSLCSFIILASTAGWIGIWQFSLSIYIFECTC